MNNKIMPIKPHRGFTLIEIVIVLIIISLLIGGILKGQSLITNARVNSIINTTQAVQTAYYAFIDKYRRIPGDIDAKSAARLLGQNVNGGGNNNGRVDDTAGSDFDENNALWEHLTKGSYLRGEYQGRTGTPDLSNNLSPVNAFSAIMLLGNTTDYLSESGRPSQKRLTFILGRNMPVDVAFQIDNRLDDGRPLTGSIRGTVAFNQVKYYKSSANWSGQSPDCFSAATNSWNIASQSSDCNAILLID